MRDMKLCSCAAVRCVAIPMTCSIAAAEALPAMLVNVHDTMPKSSSFTGLIVNEFPLV